MIARFECRALNEPVSVRLLLALPAFRRLGEYNRPRSRRARGQLVAARGCAVSRNGNDSIGRSCMRFATVIRTVAFWASALLMAVSLRGFIDVPEWQTGSSAWVAVLPGLVVAGYFTVGFFAYMARCLWIGPYRDPETEARDPNVILGSWVQAWIAWMIRPIWVFLAAADIRPNVVTSFSVLLAAGSGVALSQEMFGLGGWLYLASGLCDLIDGRLARFTGHITNSGKALDSILDRYSESFVLIGLAYYYRADWMLIAVLLLLAGSYQVSYVRARGEGLGAYMKFGLMQRAERLAILGLAAIMSPVVASWTETGPEPRRYWLMVGTILFLASTTQYTALVRLVHLLGVLDGEATNQAHGRRRPIRWLIIAVATGMEFALLLFLTEYFQVVKVWAVAAAGAIGAVALSLAFVRFTATTRPTAFQLSAFVGISSVLQVSGMAIVENIPGVGYILAWWLVRLSILATWSYPLLSQSQNGNVREETDTDESDMATLKS